MAVILRILIMATALYQISDTWAAERPNILWISCEDISPHLGCYGDSDARTPNLDRLASEGIRYTHAFTCHGVCAPSRIGRNHYRDVSDCPWSESHAIKGHSAG